MRAIYTIIITQALTFGVLCHAVITVTDERQWPVEWLVLTGIALVIGTVALNFIKHLKD